MGWVRISIDRKGVSHEVEFEMREGVNMVGEWRTDDYEALLASAVKSIKASIDASDGK